MNVKDLLSNANLAFLNQENETALSLANQAIKLDRKNANAYKTAANACMSLERYEDAIKNYKQAVTLDPANGNRYYDLGFACASSNKLADAIKAFAKAEELGCTPENLTQLYHILGITCFDIGRYDDALINLTKAEQLIGVDLEIMLRKVAVYGAKNDIRNGLITTNQIKLIAPSEFVGYNLAFKLLIQAKRLDAAARELDIAAKYTKPSMAYYIDVMGLELERYKADKDKAHFDAALAALNKTLIVLKPTAKELIEIYINAAEINLQLEKADITIACLNAALNPIGAFNAGFELAEKKYVSIELSEYDVEDMIEADRARIADDLGDYGLEELVSSIEPDEDGNRDYFTVIPEDQEPPVSEVKLDEADVEFSKENIDQINRLFIGAYTLNKDYNKVIEYAGKLQASESMHHNYIGMYTEANAMKELGLPETTAKYREIIKFYRNAMIKDPTDMVAVSFRIQSNIDIGEYDEAEQLCNLLTKDAREPLLNMINKKKSGGDTN